MASPRPGEQLAAVITDGVSRAGDAPGPAEATYHGLPRRTRRRLVVASMQRSLLVGGPLLVLYFVLPLTDAPPLTRRSRSQAGCSS